jgi:hypothetical protein
MAAAADTIVLDTLGKLAGHGYGLSGYLPALPRPPSGPWLAHADP